MGFIFACTELKIASGREQKRSDRLHSYMYFPPSLGKRGLKIRNDAFARSAGEETKIRNGACARTAAEETLRNGAFTPGP